MKILKDIKDWEEMKNEVICGDCLEGMRIIPNKSIDLILTDPPWNMNYFENDNKTWEDYRLWLSALIIECERLSDNIFIFQSTKFIPEIAQCFKGYDSFASVKNFSQMTPYKLPNCWDIAFYKIQNSYKGNGRNWFLTNTAAMMKEKQGHPTQRHSDLIRYILQLGEWKLICDPFMGSWTTARACKDLGRDFIGFELSEEYCKIGEKRLRQEILF